MEEKYIMRVMSRWLVGVLLCAAGSRVYSLSCHQPHCLCVFDQVLSDNVADCQFEGSTLQTTFESNYNRITLKVNCHNAFKGIKYDCGLFPQFNISSVDAWLEIRGCGAGVARCLGGVFQAPSKIIQLNAYDLVDSFTHDDLAGMVDLDRLRIYLTDNEVELPALAINSVPSLTYSIITGGNLQLASNVFQHQKLQYFQLHLNNIEGLPPNTFNGLPNLKFLEIRSSFFKHLGAESFKGLSAVEDLVIENDTLSTIDPNAFSSMKQLTTLYIKNNTLKFVPNGLFTGLDQLYRIRFTMNQVEMSLDSHVFANLPSTVRVVDVATSRVRFLPENLLNGSSNIHQLYFHKNQIEALPPNLLATNVGLKYVDFNHNKIKELPDKIFAAMNKLEHINLGYNLITSLKGDIFTHSSELKEVYLNHNRITEIEHDIFKGAALRTVTLAYNSLQRITGDTNPGWSTNKLNLSNNKLSVFEDWFVKLNSLHNLDVSNNDIEMLKESHINLKKSKITIDLRNNRITQIIRDMGENQITTTPGDINLYLSNNPLNCDCIVITLLKDWHKYGILADYDQITCSNNEMLSNLDINIECSKTHAFIALVGSSIVFTLIIFLIIIYVFTHRYDIWEYISGIFQTDISYVIGTDNETFELKEEKVKQYDLFLSFAHPDAMFVEEKLLPILEKEFNLKVCVHYRDWYVGDLIPNQIKESVQNSSMTLILLTEHFLLSEWSNLEFNTAHSLSVEDGKPRVIIILLDEAISRHTNLSADLKTYMDVNTYILWQDMFFWEKLEKVLPKKSKPKKK